MTITRTDKGGNTGTSGSTIVRTMPSRIAVGASIIVATVDSDGGPGPPTNVTVGSLELTRDVSVSALVFSNEDINTSIWSAHEIDESSTTVTATWASAFDKGAIFVIEVTEINLFDKSSALGQDNTTTPTTNATPTTTADDEFVIAAFGISDVLETGPTPSAGFSSGSERGTTGAGANSNRSLYEIFQVASAKASFTGGLTFVGSEECAAVIATYKFTTVSVTDDCTILNDAEDADEDIADETVLAITGTVSDKVFFEGTASVIFQHKGVGLGVAGFDLASTLDVTDKHLYCATLSLDTVEPKAIGGWRIRVSGDATDLDTNYGDWFVGGSDSARIAIRGFLLHAVDCNRVFDVTKGTPPALTAVESVGVAGQFISSTGQNTHFQDVIKHCSKLTVKGGIAAAPGTTPDITASDDTNDRGMFKDINGVSYILCGLDFGDATVALDSYSDSNKDSDTDLDDAVTGVGQSITGDGTILRNIKWFVSTSGTPTGNVVSKVYAHSGSFGTTSVPTGAALATSNNVDVTTIGTTFALHDFKFDDGFTLVNTTNYVITLEFTGTSSDFINVGTDTSTPGHAGNFSTFASPTWTAVGGTDACFFVSSIETAFTDLGETWVFEDQPVSATLYTMTFIGGTGHNEFTLGQKIGSGVTATGVGGNTILAAGEAPFLMDSSDEDIAVNLFGSSFLNAAVSGGTIKLESASTEVLTCLFSGCGAITVRNGAILRGGSTIAASAEVTGGLDFGATDPAVDTVRDLNVVNNTVGILLEGTVDTTYNLRNIKFGGNTNDVRVDFDAPDTVTINILDGGDVPTIDNVNSSTVVIVNAVTVRVEGVTEAAAIVVIANETVGTITIGDVILTGQADLTGALEDTAFNYEGAFNPSGLDVIVRARGSGLPAAVIADDNGSFVDETTVANNDIANTMTLLPASPVANQDRYYYGHPEKFAGIKLDVTDAATGATITYEYYNGTIFTALSGVTDGTSNYANTGSNKVTWTIPGDWVTTTVNSQGPYFYVRGSLTAGTPDQARGRRVTYDVTKYLPFNQENIITSSGLTVKATWIEDTIATF